MQRQISAFRYLVALGALLVASAAPAAIVELEFSNLFSDGAVAPTGAAPWLRVTFDDDTGNNSTVQVTIAALGSLNDADVTDLYFNLNPAISLDPGEVTVTETDNLFFTMDSISGGDGSIGAIVTSYGTDAFKADGDGLYDIRFDLPPPPGNDRLNAGETLVFTITRGENAPLTAMDFFELSAPDGGSGPFIAATHLQSTGVDTEGSAWVSATLVPLPAAGWLLISSLGLIGFVLRRRR